MAKSAIIKVVALADVARLTSGMSKASKSVKDFEKSGLSSLKKFAKGAALAGAALVVTGLVQATKAAVEDAKSQAVLAKSMQNTMGATKGAIAESEKFIQKMQTQVAIADDQLRPAYSTLIRSTQDVTQAQSLLTLATDISAGTGKDLGMVTQALGKAYNGQYASLNKLIPGISKAKDPMEQLKKQFGGMAEAAANNDPFARMKVIFDDLSETVGTILIPVMNTLLDAIKPLIDTLAPILTNIVGKLAPILTAIIGPLGKFLGKLLTDVSPLIDVILELAGIFIELLSPILDVIGTIVGELAKALLILIKPLIPLTKSIMPIFKKLIEQSAKSMETLMPILTLLAQLLADYFTGAFKDAIPFIEGATNALTAFLKPLNTVLDAMADAIRKARLLLGQDVFGPGGLTGDQQNARAADVAALYGYGEFAAGKKKPKPKTPGTGGKSPAEVAREQLKGAIDTLQSKLDEAKSLIQETVAKFRNSVDTAFGLVQRGSGMVFRADRYIRELKRMKAATADFNTNLQKLRDMGGKAANPLLEQILSKSPEEAAAIMRSFTASPELFAEAIKTTGQLAATGGLVGAQQNAMAGNQPLNEMVNEMKLLRAELKSGKNTYNIKATMSAAEIVTQIRAWEKSTGKTVLVG